MITEAKGLVEDEEAISGSISLCNDVGKEGGCLSIYGEGLNLKDDLDNAVKDGDDEVGQREPGGVDSRPLLEGN